MSCYAQDLYSKWTMFLIFFFSMKGSIQRITRSQIQRGSHFTIISFCIWMLHLLTIYLVKDHVFYLQLYEGADLPSQIVWDSGCIDCIEISRFVVLHSVPTFWCILWFLIPVRGGIYMKISKWQVVITATQSRLTILWLMLVNNSCL